MHTNPILVTFCSILYYKDLGIHIKLYKIEKKLLRADSVENFFFMKKFSGKLPNETHKNQDENSTTKTYKKHIINRWHVLVKLSLNKELIQFRRHNLRREINYEDVSLFKQIKDNIFQLLWNFILLFFNKKIMSSRCDLNLFNSLIMMHSVLKYI